MADTRESKMAKSETSDHNAAAIWEILHKQADIVRDQGAVLAETKAEVKGLGGQLRDFMDSYRDGQSHVMRAIEDMSKPKANNLWQIIAVCLVILGMFGGVMVKTVADSKEVASLKFDHAREIGDLRFHASDDSAKQQQVELKALYTRQEKFSDALQTMAFEGGKQQQKLEDLTLFARRMDNEIQSRFLSAEQRLTQVESGDAANTTNLRALGDYLKEHANKQGSAGHPSPTSDVRVKEQPIGVSP